MQEIWVQFLVQEDPLQEGRATHSRTEEPIGLQSIACKESDTADGTEYASCLSC